MLGGSKGAVDAFRFKPEMVDSMRMRVTRLLNMSGKAGRGSGNALGVMGLFFSSAESALGYVSDEALPESANSIAAGANQDSFLPCQSRTKGNLTTSASALLSLNAGVFCSKSFAAD